MSDCSIDSPGAEVGNYERRGTMPEGLPVGKAVKDNRVPEPEYVGLNPDSTND